MADGEEFLIGTPVVSGINVKATVVEHFRGPKVFRFKYSPKKRIRVRGGHRQQYTRLMVDFIGRPDEKRNVEKVEKPVKQEVVVEAVAEKTPKAEKKQAKAPAKEAKVANVKKAPAKKSTSSKSTTKSAPKKK